MRLPALDGWGFGYQKFNRRSEDWAMVAVSAVVKQTGDTCEDVRVGLTNMGSVPLRAPAVEDALRGQPLTPARSPPPPSRPPRAPIRRRT